MVFTNTKQMSKKDKGFYIFNITLSFLMSAACVALAFYYGLVNNWNNRLFSAIIISVVSILPFVLQLIIRKRFPNILFLGINIYILFAGVLGSAANLYYVLPWYDIVIHTIMGYCVAMVGLFLICGVDEHKKMSPIFVALFCLFFSLGVELLWEIIERFADVFLSQTAQGPKIDGTNAPLVSDTIEDLICNLSGALLFFVHFVIDRFTKLKLGFDYIIKDFESSLKGRKKDKKQDKNDEKTAIETDKDDPNNSQ